MGKRKGRREGDDTTSGGHIGSRKRKHTKEKVKKNKQTKRTDIRTRTKRNNHNKTIQSTQRRSQCVHCQKTWEREITKAPVTAAALQPDTANAGCTFSENMEQCASAAKPGSGRHAVRQAKLSRAKEEGRRKCLSAEQKRGKANSGLTKRRRELLRESVMDAGLFRQKRPDWIDTFQDRGFSPDPTYYSTSLSACRPGAQQLYSCRATRLIISLSVW